LISPSLIVDDESHPPKDMYSPHTPSLHREIKNMECGTTPKKEAKPEYRVPIYKTGI